MIAAAEDIVLVGRAFEVMAQLINLFGYGGLTVIVIAISAVIVWNLVTIPERTETFFYALLIVIAAAPLWMVRPQKEILVVILTGASLLVLKLVPLRALQMAIICALYVLYADLAGRIYYYLIPLAFILFAAGSFSGGRTRIVLVLGVIAGLLLAPHSLIAKLNEVRNALDLFVVREHLVHTAWLNPLSGNSVFDFLGNYFYAAVRINFPILFHIRAQETFLTIFSIAWLRLLVAGFRSSNPIARMAACLIAAHMTVEFIFEPDLGSYLRHISSTVPLILPLLAALDAEQFTRRRMRLTFSAMENI
ncbi:MAG: hypothetical protein ACREFD_18140 [Stellaceae bacterium]